MEWWIILIAGLLAWLTPLMLAKFGTARNASAAGPRQRDADEAPAGSGATAATAQRLAKLEQLRARAGTPGEAAAAAAAIERLRRRLPRESHTPNKVQPDTPAQDRQARRAPSAPSRSRGLLGGIICVVAVLLIGKLVGAISHSNRAQEYARKVDWCWDIMARRGNDPGLIAAQAECRPFLRNQVTQRFKID